MPAAPVAPDMPAAEPDATIEGAPTAKPKGEARVVLEKQSSLTVGPSTQLFRGKVKNHGGTEATNVVVRLSVTETQQGAECLRAEIDVAPSSLPPGETGEFETEVDNACFFGDISVQIEPDWD